MRLNRVNEHRGNGINPIMLIAVAVIAVILLIVVGYFLFGNGSEESISQTAAEPDNAETATPKKDPFGSQTDNTLEEPTDVPTRTPSPLPTATAVPTPTVIPTPTPTPTPSPTLVPTPVPTIDIAKSPLPEVVNDNPPHVFVGTVTIDGQIAPDGTEVSAWMLQYSEPVGSSVVPAVAGQPGSYRLLIPQYGKNFNGTVVRIKVDGNFVTNAVWQSGEGEILDLVP